MDFSFPMDGDQLMKPVKTLCAAMLLGATGALPALGAELEVVVHGVASTEGTVMIRVYQGKKGWLKTNGIEQRTLSLEEFEPGGTLTTVFELPKGEYAISAYHDEDDDGKLDSNFIGIPKEPAGMSREPKARMGPPKYEDAAFELTEEGLSMPVTVN